MAVLPVAIVSGQLGHISHHEELHLLYNGLAGTWADMQALASPNRGWTFTTTDQHDAEFYWNGTMWRLIGLEPGHAHPYEYGALIDGVTDDAAALTAALTSGALFVHWVGDLGFTGKISVPYGVNLQGLGGGWSGTSDVAASRLVCLDATAQLAFGDLVLAGGNRGGLSGGFVVDGNGIATQPLYFGQCVQRTFLDISSVNSAGDGLVVEAAQNCLFMAVDSENHDGHGWVWDLGAGNNMALRCEISQNGGYNVIFQQSGASPAGAFTSPENNEMQRCVIERYIAGSLGSVYHGNGRNNVLNDCALSATLGAPFSALITLRRDNTALASILKVKDGSYSGTAGVTNLFDCQSPVGHGAILVVEGRVFAENGLHVFYVDDNTTVEVGKVNAYVPGGYTDMFGNAGGGVLTVDSVLRDRRFRERITWSMGGSTELPWTIAINGEAIPRLTVDGSGKFTFSDGIAGHTATIGFAQSGGVNGLQVVGPLRWPGVANIEAADSAPSAAYHDGSLHMRGDDGGSIYQRQSGAWVRLGNIIRGTGTPEGAVTAPVGVGFLRDDGAAASTLYLKESGTGNTGWVPVWAGSIGTFTQTYATADATLSAYTPDDESVAYTGAADGEAKLTDLNALRVAYENLRAFTEDLAAFTNALIDAAQANGFVG